MPWEKNFDIEEATKKAIKIFWEKGYEATSMADLINGMGINKGSLYNAFGSKKELFDRALLQYDKNNRQKALQQLGEIADGKEAIITLFDGLLTETKTDTENRGCMLVNTALELPLHKEDVTDMIKGAFGEFETFFVEAIKKGQALGSIPKEIIPEQTAKALLSLVVGLRVLARGAYSAEDIQAIRNDAVRMVSHR